MLLLLNELIDIVRYIDCTICQPPTRKSQGVLGTRVIQLYYKYIYLKLKCVRNVSEMRPKCVRNVSEMRPKCVRNVSEMCPKSVPNLILSLAFTIYSLKTTYRNRQI